MNHIVYHMSASCTSVCIYLHLSLFVCFLAHVRTRVMPPCICMALRFMQHAYSVPLTRLIQVLACAVYLSHADALPAAGNLVLLRTSDSATLTSQLSLIKETRVQSGTQPRIVLTCPMTVGVMEALQALPEWVKQVDFSACTWPEEAAVYKQLALCIPLLVEKWVVAAQPQTELARKICAGIRERRAKLGLKPLQLQLGTGVDVLFIKQEEHMTVTVMKQGYTVK